MAADSPAVPNAGSPLAPFRAGLPAYRWIGYLLASVALLIPCYWQPRIQAGDLSSHIYNAWLAQLIEAGGTDGLIIVRQHNNVLFDLILDGLFRLWGPEWAQRVAVAAAVLIFVWGAFAFVSKVSGTRPRHLLPTIATLAYGWVFHMGFFNFYLSLGLVFWALALGWEFRLRRLAITAALLALAYTAHALPVVWAICLLAYSWVAGRIAEHNRMWLVAGAVLVLIAIRLLIACTLVSIWIPQQISLAGLFGADQLWVFDRKYFCAVIGLLVLWVSLLFKLLRRLGGRKMSGGIPLQLILISAAAVLILPTTVLIPGYRHTLAYMAERMSLPVAVLVCALLGSARPRWFEQWGLAAVALIFFALLYHDERDLNRFEDRMDGVIAQLPPGQRVISPVTDPELRVNALAHMVDRSCLGRCYSYANYEASTAQFRVQAVAPNGFVVDNYRDSWNLQTGKYIVRDRDLPLYCIVPDQQGRMQVESMKAGALCESASWSVLRNTMPGS